MMKPRYVVINEVERNEFENKWQVPYGYGEFDIHIEIEDAIDEIEEFYYGSNEWVIEKITDEGRQIVYRGGKFRKSVFI